MNNWLHRTAAIVLLCCSTEVLHSADGPGVAIGSKAFTESVVLGELIGHLSRVEGAIVHHRAELGGTQFLWQALIAGDIDVYVDYTGTIREELLAEVIKSGAEVRTEADMRNELAKMHVLMSDRLGFNNTYALGMRESTAEQLQIRTISDLRAHPELKFAFSDEFMERKDGWRALAKKYDLPQKKVRTMDHNLAYRGIEHDAIQLTDLYTTDAEIEFYKLRTLEDDLGYFPTYHAVILMRDDLPKRAPKVAESILRMQNLIEPTEMVSMTAQVRLDRQMESNVAANYLRTKLNLDIPLSATSRGAEFSRIAARLAKTTYEHLFLVLVSLSLAIAVAVPLGITSARSENVGNAVLGIVGVIQTLPSMALLVFMIPIFGLGAVPAIAALFFYSLLPIVRNTYTGLTQIPVAIRESAEVIGLSSGAKLRLVELPLALPSILAGIKTAAVINVGTATIGALIGAGGYGSPILTGIRLSSVSLILQGAVPAALLAIGVQFVFGWIERRFVSPGLRSH